MSQLLTVNEVAERLGRPPEEILGLVQDGLILGVYVQESRTWRVEEHRLQEWLSGQHRSR